MHPFGSKRCFTAFAVVVATAFAGAPAFAQQSPESRMSASASLLAPYPASPARGAGAALYRDSASQNVFVLDRTGDAALMKFANSPEVKALNAATGPRGDTFLRDDSGRLILRVTELGNVISYMGDKDGAPADMDAAASPLDAPVVSDSLADMIDDVRARLRKAVGRDVSVFGAAAFAQDEQWAGDALMVAVLGVSLAKKDKNSAAKGLESVRLLRAARPQIAFQNNELILGVNPALGYAGRPSSDAIAQALGANRQEP